ncbi:hypothetical protein MNBD_GAMMA07-1416 [hydrothermal vent metagenome]|uniref:FHA domain-containing protein n=1 Tax=hydrothermal vent metagenome TaxID=652676 RepID=A0A3B0WM92_9ZZZZ
MAIIILSFNGEIEKEFSLDKEVVTIGRKSDNDIILDNLAISTRHAKIITLMNDSFIEDLNSTNGTLLNGNPVSKNILSHGDVIKFGKHEIKYINSNALSSDDFEKTMIINTTSHGLEETEGSEEIHQSVGKIIAEIASTDIEKNDYKKAKIRLHSGVNDGKELTLKKILTTLGKPGVQVAAITRRPTGYFLVHIDGGNNDEKPLVNNKVIKQQAHKLHDNDELEVAGIQMTFILN